MDRDIAGRDISFRRRVLSSVLSLAGIPGLFRKRGLPVRPKKILAMQWAYLGDMAVSTPALRLLRQAYPDSEITLLTNPETEGYISGCPFADRIIYMKNPLHLGRRRFSVAEVFGCISRLREERYDLVVELTGRLANQAFLFFLKAGYLAGQDPTDNAYFLDRRVKSGRRPEIDRSLDVVSKSIGHEPENISRAIWNPVTDTDREFAGRILSEQGIGDYIVIHPMGSWGPRQWPIERWAELASILSSRGKGLIFIGSPQDRAMIEDIRSALKDAKSLNLAGAVTIRQCMALMERARFFVGIDSGPMHMAAAAGLKGVILFGPGDPVKWAHPLHKIIYKRPDCGPCAQFAFSKVCRKGFRRCAAIEAITVKEVSAACEEYLRGDA